MQSGSGAGKHSGQGNDAGPLHGDGLHAGEFLHSWVAKLQCCIKNTKCGHKSETEVITRRRALQLKVS